MAAAFGLLPQNAEDASAPLNVINLRPEVQETCYLADIRLQSIGKKRFKLNVQGARDRLELGIFDLCHACSTQRMTR